MTENKNKYEEILQKAREKYAEAADVLDHSGEHLVTAVNSAAGIKGSLEAIFGREVLRPQINTWEDLVEAGKAEFANISTRVESLCAPFAKAEPVAAKMQATWKIAQLIEAAYGGLVTNDEWSDSSREKYVIRPTTPTQLCFGVECPGENGAVQVCKVTNRSKYRFIAFHTREQADRFLRHNRDLCEQYYLLPYTKPESE